MEKNALEAIQLLKEWSTWLVAIETASIAAIAAGAKDLTLDAGACMAVMAKLIATGAVVAFGISIISALYLLLALPGVSQRLPEVQTEDIFSMPTPAGFKLKLSWYVRFERWGSVFGFFCLAGLILIVVWTRHLG
jgi:hypothetical protein